MSAAAAEAAVPVPPGASVRQLLAGPREGWSSLVLLVLMALTLAWSIDDARWVLGRDDYTDFLAWMAVPAVIAGFVLAKTRRSRWFTLPAGAALGAGLLALAVGMTIAPKAGGLAEEFQAAAASVVGAWLDLVVRGRATTTQVGHFLLLLGVIVWGTAFFASWTTYRHRRPMNAAFAIGTVLVANMAITVRDQFYLLVIFSIAALLFIVRLHVSDEQRTWVRHRIDDAGRTGGLYLRGGLAFVVVAIIGALVLTNTAASAPLAPVWDGVNQRLLDIGSQLSRLLPGGGPGTRVGGIVFGQTAAISGSWLTDDTPVMRVHVPDAASYSWRAVAYDQFTGNAWSWTDTRDVRLGAATPVLASTLESIDGMPGRREVTFEIDPSEAASRLIVSPNGPATIDRPARLTLIDRGDAGTFFATLTATDGGRLYRVTALVPDINPNDPKGLTANKLRAAGADYPPAVAATYTTILPGTVGQPTFALLGRIERESGAANPYDLARAIERYLRDPANFTYDTDVTNVDCQGRGVVDCFAVSRRGYCEYYASTMAMMLRVRGIPTRMVEGFLPGDRDASGVETVRRNRSHAWVEVYFPGYGWLDFDPTGGGVGRVTNLPVGPPVASPTPKPSGSFVVDNGERDRLPTIRPAGGGSTTSSDGAGLGPLPLVIAALLLVGLLILALTAFLRRPPVPTPPDAVYGMVARIAGRLGYGPRPSQTVYEYAGSLAEALPSIRPELTLVATAKVESTYARRELGLERLRALGAAKRRLRVRLLGLAFRRPGRRRRR